jgi:hypothetical protein
VGEARRLERDELVREPDAGGDVLQVRRVAQQAARALKRRVFAERLASASSTEA